MSLIEATQINFSYGQHAVLKDVTFTINEGDFVGIIGPNGGGKTTLLRLLLGLLKPTAGHLTLFDQTPSQLKQRSLIGYVPQRITQSEFNFPATVEEVVRSGLTAKLGIARYADKHDNAAVAKAMKLAGITEMRDRLIGQLSGGERQRVFIARALASGPKLLILDEPTVGVDITSQENFYTLLCELNHKHNLTIILVSHDIDVIAQEVQTLLFLNRTVVAYGKPKELMKEKYLEKLYDSHVKFIEHHH